MKNDEYITILEKLKAYDYWPIEYKSEMLTVEFDEGFIFKGTVFSHSKFIPRKILRFVKKFASNEQNFIVDQARNTLVLCQSFPPSFTAKEFFEILDVFIIELKGWRSFFDGLSRQDLVFFPR